MVWRSDYLKKEYEYILFFIYKLKLLFIVTLIFFCSSCIFDSKTNSVVKSSKYKYYTGLATCRETKEEARESAYLNAKQEILREIAEKIMTEIVVSKEEINDNLNIYFKQNSRGISYGLLKGVEKIKEKITPSNKGQCYDAEVIVRISRKDFEKAKQNWNYDQTILLDEIRKYFDEAKNEEKRRNIKEAISLYNTAIEISKNVFLPEARSIEIAASNKLLLLEDPKTRLMFMEGNKNIVDSCKLVNGDTNEFLPFYIPIGTKFKLKFLLKDSAYLYVLAYDKNKKEFRLIFPNLYDQNNYFLRGKNLLPKGDVYFNATPLPGINHIIVIASFEKININFEGNNTPYLVLDKSTLNNFLLDIKISTYDIKDIEIYIVEGE